MQASKEQQASLKRLKKRAEFLHVQKAGRKWTSQGLVLQICPNKTDEKRVGFTVSKRAEKSAVKRNRIKRRLRSAAADILPEFAKNAHDYVLIGRAQTLIRPYDTLCEDLKWCLKKLEVLKAP